MKTYHSLMYAHMQAVYLKQTRAHVCRLSGCSNSLDLCKRILEECAVAMTSGLVRSSMIASDALTQFGLGMVCEQADLWHMQMHSRAMSLC